MPHNPVREPADPGSTAGCHNRFRKWPSVTRPPAGEVNTRLSLACPVTSADMPDSTSTGRVRDDAPAPRAKKVARKVGRGYDVLEDGGGAVGVSGGGTTVGVCVGFSVGVCVGFSVGVCVGVTTAVGVFVTTTVVVLLELQPVIAAAMTAVPQPITKIIFALLIPSPPRA